MSDALVSKQGPAVKGGRSGRLCCAPLIAMMETIDLGIATINPVDVPTMGSVDLACPSRVDDDHAIETLASD